MTFKFFSDPGHGWLRVDVQSAESVGLAPGSFSRFSYRQSHWLYLEEDCDASLFVTAYLKKNGQAPRIVEHSTDRPSIIRNYERID
jgi:hypothetical protein